MSILYYILYQPLFNALILIYDLIPDMGIAIIILTVMIRFILWPSQTKALKSQRELAKLQPEIDRIKKKHPKDQARQTQAILAMYKEKKVSPFSSCLPLLIQFPILIALYSVFRHSMDTASLSALYPFIPKPDTINPTLLGILDLSKPDRYVLPILTGALQFIQTRMMTKVSGPKPQAGTAFALTAQMNYIFPIMTVIIAISLPAALPLYWVATTAVAILQQYIIMRDDKDTDITKKEKNKAFKKIGRVKIKIRRNN